jgi:hypothetical protein
MKKIFKISYLYFATGLILALCSILNQENQEFNLYDKYYVISANDFALFVSLIYLIIGLIFLVIEDYLRKGIKVFQYLLFNIPVIYFIFSDLSVYNNPGYYLGNQIAFKWNTIYIPVVLIFSLILSSILILILYVFAFIKWRMKNMTSK